MNYLLVIEWLFILLENLEIRRNIKFIRQWRSRQKLNNDPASELWIIFSISPYEKDI